jgi:hypothetical protein
LSTPHGYDVRANVSIVGHGDEDPYAAQRHQFGRHRRLRPVGRGAELLLQHRVRLVPPGCDIGPETLDQVVLEDCRAASNAQSKFMRIGAVGPLERRFTSPIISSLQRP